MNWSAMGISGDFPWDCNKWHTVVTSQCPVSMNTLNSTFLKSPLNKMWFCKEVIPQMAGRCRCRQYHPYCAPRLGSPTLPFKNSTVAPYLPPLTPGSCPKCSPLVFLWILTLPSTPLPWCPGYLARDSEPSRQQSQRCDEVVPVLPCTLSIITCIQIIYQDLYPRCHPTHILPSLFNPHRWK